MTTAKKAPNSQRPIERSITIRKKSAAKIIAIMAENYALEELIIQVCRNEITSPVISSIFELKNLNSVNLSYNAINDTGARDIGMNLLDSNIRILDLACNYIGDAGTREIAKNMKNLTRLYLEHNEIGPAGATEIIKNIVGSNVTTLYLGENLIHQQAHQQLIDKWDELGNNPEKLTL